jgi:hypothetical protein
VVKICSVPGCCSPPHAIPFASLKPGDIVLLADVLWPFSGCVTDRDEESGRVLVVESGDGVAEVDGDACGEAG